MDPLSITTSVSSLLVVSVRVVKALHDLHSSYEDAPVLLSSISSECSVIYASLTLLQNLQLVSRIPGQGSSQIFEAFDTALLGCALTLSVLDRDIKSCLEAGKSPNDAAAVKRLRVVLEKDHLEELLRQIRGHQTALTLLLTTIQTQSMSELKDLINDNQVVLERLAGKARALWQDRQRTEHVPNTVFGSSDSVFELSSIVTDTRFDFDEEILASTTYQRALRNLQVFENFKVDACVSEQENSISTTDNVSDQDDVDEETVTIVPHEAGEGQLGTHSNDHKTTSVLDLDKDWPLISSTSFRTGVDTPSPIPEVEVASISEGFQIPRKPIQSRQHALGSQKSPNQPQSLILPQSPVSAVSHISDTHPVSRNLVIVGDSCTGKTALLIRFSEGTFEKTHIPTVVGNYVADVEINGQPVKLYLWDTSREHDRFRPLSYPHSHVVLICFAFDSPDSLESVQETFISEVRHFCPGLPIILVGTHNDLRDDPRVIAELAKTLQKPVTLEQGEEVKKKIGAIKYLECSSKTNEGVREVFRAATRYSLLGTRKRSKLSRLFGRGEAY